MEWKILIDDGEEMPSLGDVCFGLLLANSSNDLMGYLLDRHHPKQTFAFGHCCIDKAGAMATRWPWPCCSKML